MNRSFLFLMVAMLLVPLACLIGCEGDTGPAGPAGADGTDGMDGADGADGANGYTPAMCLDCHNNAADLEIQLAYTLSGHKAGEYVGYAGGRESCAKCHSKQGFIEYIVHGEVSGDIDDPAPIDCATCHTVHPADFGLRTTDPVEMIFDEGAVPLDLGDDSNLCANCHQSRRAEPNVAEPGTEFEITSTHYGPHHGAQANVFGGVGFAEIAGSVPYPVQVAGAGHGDEDASCIACHMFEFADGVGGHSWNPHPDACAQCHAGADDFDINNFQTDTQAKLDALRDLLEGLGVIEYVTEDEAWEPIVGTYPMIQAQAFFNWIGLVEDRSMGVHNPAYVDALLDNTIEALTP